MIRDTLAMVRGSVITHASGESSSFDLVYSLSGPGGKWQTSEPTVLFILFTKASWSLSGSDKGRVGGRTWA